MTGSGWKAVFMLWHVRVCVWNVSTQLIDEQMSAKIEGLRV